MTAPSKRFSSSRLTRYLVPAALTLLTTGLLLVLFAVVLAVAGYIPVG